MGRIMQKLARMIFGQCQRELYLGPLVRMGGRNGTFRQGKAYIMGLYVRCTVLLLEKGV
jgi:hypothetical protein